MTARTVMSKAHCATDHDNGEDNHDDIDYMEMNDDDNDDEIVSNDADQDKRIGNEDSDDEMSLTKKDGNGKTDGRRGNDYEFHTNEHHEFNGSNDTQGMSIRASLALE